ncbi:hypothetical protein [Gordonia tangerina]|uniref:Uncharacterized protein n=1 Tax=Gordonia tangerina TaxID=2911060 RepID=A0ABS9DLJ7_9ACTN|nr:hypothetical protein [Gordonia tangerina]MCF3939956.1 hypothetical protein [Gordonia tangerina]
MALNQRSTPCDIPVAVVKDVTTRTDYRGRPEIKVMTKVACLRHLAARFTGSQPSKEEPAMERAALEELAAKHWDEFQDLVRDQTKKLQDARLSALPDELKHHVESLLSEEGVE